METLIEQPELNEEQKNFWNYFINNSFSKTGYYPVFQKIDSTNPKVSKFGGSIPHLPSEKVPTCSQCKKTLLEVLLQLYISNAPEEIKKLFPESKRQGLLVIFYCTNCMEQGNLVWKYYEESQLDQLVFSEPKSDSKISPTIVTEWRPFISIDSTSNRYLEESESSGFDELNLEEFPKYLKENYHGTTFLGGMPFYEQGESVPGENFSLLANLEQDNAFSMMWGDAGEAQIWMTSGDEFGNFEITWQCG